MLIVNDGLKEIEKLRKRPSKTLISAKTIRVPLGDEARKLLKIPKFDDQYNMEMGAVD